MVAINVAIWGLIVAALRKYYFFAMRDEGASTIASVVFSLGLAGVAACFVPSFSASLAIFYILNAIHSCQRISADGVKLF